MATPLSPILKVLEPLLRRCGSRCLQES